VLQHVKVIRRASVAQQGNPNVQGFAGSPNDVLLSLVRRLDQDELALGILLQLFGSQWVEVYI
jgi:hypothetical protein